MEIKLNGICTKIESELTLENLLSQQEKMPQYYVVAVNFNCIPAQEYAQVKLKHGDEVEIVSPMQGG